MPVRLWIEQRETRATDPSVGAKSPQTPGEIALYHIGLAVTAPVTTNVDGKAAA